MSYDIYLLEPEDKRVIEFDVPHRMEGGTYCVGGTSEAWISVTYNYARHYGELGEGGILSIIGMTGEQSIPILQKVADKLGDDVDLDYWKPTEGNAKAALLNLIEMAKMRPDGIWGGG